MTQKLLAKSAGLFHGHLSALENGDKEPKLATLKKLATVLKISIDELIRDEPGEAEIQSDLSLTSSEKKVGEAVFAVSVDLKTGKVTKVDDLGPKPGNDEGFDVLAGMIVDHMNEKAVQTAKEAPFSNFMPFMSNLQSIMIARSFRKIFDAVERVHLQHLTPLY